MADIVVPIVVENLIKLLAYESNLLGGVEDGVISLKSDLEFMNAFLKKSAGKRSDEIVEVVLHGVANQTSSIKGRIQDIYENKARYDIGEADQPSVDDDDAEKSLQRRRRNVEEDDVSFKQLSEETPKLAVEDLKAELHEHLKEKTYLIVMDDVWSTQVWEELRVAFPNKSNGSRILITTREREVASHASPTPPYELQFLDENESWELLQKKVFQGGQCLPNLEERGRELARSCRGLPLSIVLLGGILASKEKSHRVWSRFLGNVNSYLAEGVSILKLSYKNLPRELKPCFLYVGMFPEESEIIVKDLIEFWIAEGFIHSARNTPIYDVAEDYLEKLMDRSMIQVATKRVDGETLHLEFRAFVPLPKGIWSVMKNLRYLYLPAWINLDYDFWNIPRRSLMGEPFWNLQVLSWLHVNKNTALVIAKFPKLRTLGLSFGVENKFPDTWLMEEDEVEKVMASIRRLESLESFKIKKSLYCRIEVGKTLNSLPSTLTKISWTSKGIFYWDTFKVLARQPHLRFLKLTGDRIQRDYIRELPHDVRVVAGEFPQLQVLKLRDLTIKTLEMEKDAIPNLQSLFIERCNELEYLPEDELLCRSTLQLVEMIGWVQDKLKIMLTDFKIKRPATPCKINITED
ncbi:hypothetical protein FNV43_RR20357 [Rhamnella rubrinervis]|uniref:Uncharacterized protein n=1 Tax=Rhamnella rubrinervis TaxID=2594499 RepID=A0A8K0DVS5_9ROSA|nr:hypothetical protein FNV43_RR20357 [Rhamnella rubrinervis]